MTAGIVEKIDVAAVENVEEAIPIDLFEPLFGLAEIDAQHAAGSFDNGGMPVILLNPGADFIVIVRALCCCQKEVLRYAYSPLLGALSVSPDDFVTSAALMLSRSLARTGSSPAL